MTIYVLQYGELFKIGFTNDLSGRIRSIIRSIPGGAVEFVGSMPGDRDVEQHLHKAFDASRFSGEWFTASPELNLFCAAILDHQMPVETDGRSARQRRADSYPEYTRELRRLGQSLCPETEHRARIDALAAELGWTRSRTKKLYYGEENRLTDEEAAALDRALA
jgi:hypothetical protein